MGSLTKIQIVFSESDERDHAKALLEIRNLLKDNLISMSWQHGDDMKRLKHNHIMAQEKK